MPIEPLLFILIVVLVIAAIVSLLPVDARAKNILWIIVLLFILFYFLNRL